MSSGPAAGQNLKKLGSLPGVDPFDNSLSVQEIFGNLSGSLLLDAIFQTYQIGDNKTRVRFFLDENSTDDTAVPFASRQVGIVRHAFNQRRHAGVKQAYIKSCMARGIVEGVRGECWIGEPKPDALGVRKGPYQALTYGSLLESFYTALNMEPRNPLLIRTLQRGLECRLFSHKVPESVAKYMVKLHNRFHQGAGVSFIELIQTVPDASWLINYSCCVIRCDIQHYSITLHLHLHLHLHYNTLHYIHIITYIYSYRAGFLTDRH